MKKPTSEGKCLFCSKTFKKAGINRHLQKHLEDKTKQGQPGKSFLLKIEPDPSWGSSPYFLSIWMDGEEANFCEKCAKKHAQQCEDFEDYSAMLIVNSPRMGVCGYEGGTIDLERDGIITLDK